MHQEIKIMPRFMIAAPGSGHGKTMITCGLLSLLKQEKKRPIAFKCGPDYIDPMFHKEVLGIPSYNLDSWFSDPDTLSYLIGRHAGQDEKIAVLEGVMGYYDGLGGVSLEASSFDVAEKTKTPVILVVNGSGSSRSVIASISGFLHYQKESMIRGVILNQVSAPVFERLAPVCEEELGIPVVGYVPKIRNLCWEKRHLGLLKPEENKDFESQIAVLLETFRKTIDLGKLLSIAEDAEPLTYVKREIPVIRRADGSSPVIAVAKDEAFCFYYDDNLELLEKMGAELRYFSPVHDAFLPEHTDGIYLGGGYPELYTKELSENKTMRSAIRTALENGIPYLAECGGYLYLGESLKGEDGVSRDMVGYFPGSAENQGKLVRFGYVTLTKKDQSLGENREFRAHEFHYWDRKDNGNACHVTKPYSGKEWDCGYMDGASYAGFPHLYFYQYSPIPFLKAAAAYKRKRMEDQRLELELSRIRHADRKAMNQAIYHLNHLAKPIGSLGILEKDLIRCAGMTGNAEELRFDRAALVVFCADHGVVAEGVTQTGQEVTGIVAENFTRNKTSTSIMLKRLGADVYPVDIGMVTDHEEEKKLTAFHLTDRKIAHGTRNLKTEPAMSREEAEQAIFAGIEIAKELKDRGYEILLTGEMGIGNTTPTSCISSVLTGMDPKSATGRGAGLSDAGLKTKMEVVEAAVRRFYLKYPDFRETDREDILSLLQELGGFEIAGMAGLFLGGAICRIPVMMDGMISSASALMAAMIEPKAKDYMIATHLTTEPVGRKIMEKLGMEPPLHLAMHLGEGSGAASYLPLLQMASDVYDQMDTFHEIEMEDYEVYEEGKS